MQIKYHKINPKRLLFRFINYLYKKIIMEVSIYGLVDPRNNLIRYVGKTKQTLNKRLSQHMSDTGINNTHKFNWIKNLKELNLKPIIILLETCDGDLWVERERYYIRIIENLTNLTEGGEEGLFFTKEILEKISEGIKKKWLEPEFRDKMSKIRINYWSNPENRKIQSDKLIGYKQSKSHQLKQSERKVNEWSDSEYREKMSLQSKNLWNNKEYRNKTLKHLQSNEYKEIVSKRFKGINKSEETKLKMSASRKNKKSVIIEGVVYDSIAEASKLIPINRDKLKARINSKNFTEYNYNDNPQ